jgi:hypothetical protein
MTGYALMLVLHAAVMCIIGWWYVRAYRKAAHRSRRELERILANDRSAALEAEVEYLRHRQEILLRGLFPRGDVFPGNFIDEDPELRALCELLEIFRGTATPQDRKPNA